MWCVRLYVIAVHYDPYDIIKMCPLNSEEGKAVRCECLTCMTKWTKSAASQITQKQVLGSSWLSVRPSVHIE